jgi:hypothetical protein
MAAITCSVALHQPQLVHQKKGAPVSDDRASVGESGEAGGQSASGQVDWSWGRRAGSQIGTQVMLGALVLIGVACVAVYNSHVPGVNPGWTDLLPVAGLLVLVVLVFGTLLAILASLVPEARRGRSHRWIAWTLCAVLPVLALISVLEAISNTYHSLGSWHLTGSLREQLGSGQPLDQIRQQLAYHWLDLARYTVAPAALLIILAAMLRLLWRLDEANVDRPADLGPASEEVALGRRDAADRAATTERPPMVADLRRNMLALLFAGFVVGWLDYLIIVPVPLAFILAFVLVRAILAGEDEGGESTEESDRIVGGAARPESQGQATDQQSPPPSTGPRPTAWGNALFAVHRGWWLAVPLIVADAVLVLRAAFRTAQPFLPPATSLVEVVLDDVVFWLVAAFVLGYGYRWLQGNNGMVKGLLLALVAMSVQAVPALIQLWLGQRSGSTWQAVPVRGWLLLLFLAVLGARLDAESLRDDHGHLDWRRLYRAYGVEQVQFIVLYVAPLLVAVLGIVQQVRSGQTQEALKQAVESAPKLFPGGGGG